MSGKVEEALPTPAAEAGVGAGAGGSASTSGDAALEEAVQQQKQQPSASAAVTVARTSEDEGPAVEARPKQGETEDAVAGSSTAQETAPAASAGYAAFKEDATEGEQDSEDEEEEAEAIDLVVSQLRSMLSVGEETGVRLARTLLLPSLDLAGVAEHIASGKAKRIICMCGAGISVNAGIPDFRSPGSGLYHRLEQYDLPYPQAVFEIDFFKENPKPFYVLSKELAPGNFRPTPTHYFIRLLHEKGLLLRCYTQNIDSLERIAGLDPGMIVPAHGNWDTASCIRCKHSHDPQLVLESAKTATPVHCKRKGCGGLVKPDIVFFGESLPGRFWSLVPQDFPQADLLIVMGTSLVVHPFAGLIDKVGPHVPRLLVNKEKAGEIDFEARLIGLRHGFDFHPETNYRDALYLGDCDQGIRQLAEALGWAEDLDALMLEGLEGGMAALGLGASGTSSSSRAKDCEKE